MFEKNKYTEKQRFSIKKYSFGVTSALVGIFLAGANSAQAEEVNTVTTPTPVAPTQAASAPAVAPVSVATPTQVTPTVAVTTEQKTETPATTYVLKNNNVVDVTQKPKVEIKEVQATTEYVADETKDYGTKVVEKEAKNGNITTTKSYEVVKEEVKEAKEWPKVEVDYTVDNTKELPSDKIVPLKNNAPTEVDISKLSEEEIVHYLVHNIYLGQESNLYEGKPIYNIAKVSSGRKVDEFISNDEKTDKDEVERYYTNHSLSDEAYANSKVEVTNVEKLLTENEEILRKNYNNFYDRTKTLNLLERLSKGELSPESEEYATLVYHGTILDIQKQYNTFDEFKAAVLKNISSIERNYNNSRGYLGVNIDHTKSGLSDAERKEFDEKVKGLPVELFKNINTLTLTKGSMLKDDTTYAGFSLGERREILLRTHFDAGKFDGEKFDGMTKSVIVENEDGSETVKVLASEARPQSMQRIIEVLVHELAHNVDHMAGTLGYVNEFVNGTFSSTEEFKKIYKDFFEGKVVRPYYRNNIIEAFAQSFAHYVLARLEKENPSLYAGLYKPTGYIQRKVADKYSEESEGIVSIIDGDTIDVEKDGKIIQVSSDKYKNEAYYPFEKTFAYFDDLFAKLGLWSKTPIGYKIVEKEETTSKPAENGRVLVGTKPKEEITTKVEDNLLLTDVTKTSYSLNTSTGEVTPHATTLVKAKSNENLVVNELPKLDETLFAIPPKVETSKGEELKLEDKPALDETLVKPVVTPTPVVEISKGDVLVQEDKPALDETLIKPVVTPIPVVETRKGEVLLQEEKPKLDETLLVVVPQFETSKGDSLTNTKPELHLISTGNGSVQAKTEALVQEAKPILLLDGTKVPSKTTNKVTVKSDSRTIKTKAGANVLPKTTATETNSAVPAGLAAALTAAGLVVAKRRKN